MIRTAGPGHLEDRTVSAACNPYLAFAAYLTAGLDGVSREIDPGDPNLGNLYDLGMDEIRNRGIKTLPQSLAEAVSELRNDDVVLGGLGVIGEEFIDIKEAEWRDYHGEVSRWEIDRYLTMF
jgi:glutamine synthetase